MKRLVLTAIIAITAAALPCHAASLTGSYRTDDGKHTLTFSTDGTVKSTQFGKPIEAKYTTKDGKVSFTFPGGVPLTYTLAGDSSLTHPALKTYRKL